METVVSLVGSSIRPPGRLTLLAVSELLMSSTVAPTPSRRDGFGKTCNSRPVSPAVSTLSTPGTPLRSGTMRWLIRSLSCVAVILVELSASSMIGSVEVVNLSTYGGLRSVGM